MGRDSDRDRDLVRGRDSDRDMAETWVRTGPGTGALSGAGAWQRHG